MSGAPTCVVIGSGRTAGGFVAPLLAAAGWRTVLVGRDSSVVVAVAASGEVRLRTGGPSGRERRIANVSALRIDDPRLTKEIVDADLVATAVGPGALSLVGRQLAGPLRVRMDAGRPLNILTFENHRRSPQLLTAGLLETRPSLAPHIGRTIGIAGAAVWRTIAARTIGPHGVRYDADRVNECHVDGAALLDGLPPKDGSLPRLQLSDAYDDRIVEKLWLFDAGHAAAAFLGWAASCATIAEAMELPEIGRIVAAVVDEAAFAFAARQRLRPGGETLPPRDGYRILSRYADPRLADPVTRVAREPGRKLGPDDRLIGPAAACLAAGIRPVALATAAASALRYANRSDAQARHLGVERRRLGPEESLAIVSGLPPNDDLSRLICDRYYCASVAASDLGA